MIDPDGTQPLQPVVAAGFAHVVEGKVLDANGVAPLTMRLPSPVTLADREGVFAHSFKCLECDLEFVLFSWRADRHRVGGVICPECGRATPMLHWVTQLSTSQTFVTDDSQPEIYHYHPVGDAVLLNDSSEPPAHRYPTAAPASNGGGDANV